MSSATSPAARVPLVLVVAGHDPSYGPEGGAGIDADREAAEHFGAQARCVVTAWTDQDGERVRSIGARPVEEWLGEARAALAPPPAAVKSGLLPGASAVRGFATLLDELDRRALVPVVVDPVLAASGGEVFLDGEGTEALLAELLPRGVLLTPNLPEAARLAGLALAELALERAARIAAAERLCERGARAVLLKGGHGQGPLVEDLVLERGQEPRWFVHPRVEGRLHGSGCRYASAVAAQLARGLDLNSAAQAAGAWIEELLWSARRH